MHLITPTLSLYPKAQIFSFTVGVTQPKCRSYRYSPFLSTSSLPSGVMDPFTLSNASTTSSNSLSIRGAPASPSSQHPPLHLLMLQTNSSSIISSLTRILSITIKEIYFYKNRINSIPLEGDVCTLTSQTHHLLETNGLSSRNFNFFTPFNFQKKSPIEKRLYLFNHS